MFQVWVQQAEGQSPSLITQMTKIKVNQKQLINKSIATAITKLFLATKKCDTNVFESEIAPD